MITLITGGARSGKSTLAEKLARERAESVSYFATAELVDADMEERVRLHQVRRPPHWLTHEVGSDLPAALVGCTGLAIVECLGTWLARYPDFTADTDSLVAALVSRPGDTIVVTNEVGMGVHPYTEVGRRFRDALGNINRSVAEVADEVLLVVAGRVLRLDPS